MISTFWVSKGWVRPFEAFALTFSHVDVRLSFPITTIPGFFVYGYDTVCAYHQCSCSCTETSLREKRFQDILSIMMNVSSCSTKFMTSSSWRELPTFFAKKYILKSGEARGWWGIWHKDIGAYMTQKSLMITKFPHTSSEKFFTVIFSFLIPFYPVICHCVRIHISTIQLNNWLFHMFQQSIKVSLIGASVQQLIYLIKLVFNNWLINWFTWLR